MAPATATRFPALSRGGLLGAVIRAARKLREARLSLDLFNDPALDLPRIGTPTAVSFKREDLLIMDRR